MKTFKKLSFILLAAVLGGSVTNTACAQTAEEIVNKSIDAIGGKALVSSVKSVVIETSVDFNGNEMASTTYIVNGKDFKTETDFNGTKIVQVVTDKGGWALNPFAGMNSPTALPDDAVKQSQGQLYIGGPLMSYSDNGGKIELVGKDTADYKIHLTNSVGADATFYINMKTYFVDMVVAKGKQGGQEFETTVRFSDYRKTDGGPMMAFAQERVLPQVTLEITTKKVDINKEIDPKIFEMPK